MSTLSELPVSVAFPPPRSPRPSTNAVDLRADETFEQALTRATVRSERLRLIVVAVVLGLGLLRWMGAWLLLGAGLEDVSPARSSLGALTALTGVAFVYELYAVFVANRAIRLGQTPSAFMRYRNAFIETSLPTLMLILGAEASGPSYLYVVPITWFYFIFIMLSTLRLDFWLCGFTGLVASVEYALLAAHYLNVSQVGTVDPGLASPIWHAFRVGLLLGFGLLAGLLSLQIRRQFAAALRSVQDRNMVVSMFGQHVSPAVVDQLLSQDVGQRSELREVCVMFLDIQDFTTYAESRQPEEVVEYLNGLFSIAIEVINRHTGIVNKFLGDGFMAIFGAPIADDSACQNAVAAALEILGRVDAMNAIGEAAATHVRIGLHAGEVVTGNIGSAERKEYTIIGDVVNLASRLEQLNKQFGTRLLVSDTVVQGLAGQAERATSLGTVSVKGREHPVEVYRLA